MAGYDTILNQSVRAHPSNHLTNHTTSEEYVSQLDVYQYEKDSVLTRFHSREEMIGDDIIALPS